MSDISDYNDFFQRCDELDTGYEHLSNQFNKMIKKVEILTDEKKRPYFYTNLFSVSFSLGLGFLSSFTVYQMIINRRF
jgi:hypothetical protein